MNLDSSEGLLLGPGRLAAAIEFEQGEQRHRLREAVLAAEDVIEVEGTAGPEEIANHSEPALQRDGAPDVTGVRLGWNRQQVAESGAEPIGVVGLGRRVECRAS